jgi:murein DD-endopeptidase MepM/ murein hydrolase activator NlpD
MKPSILTNSTRLKFTFGLLLACALTISVVAMLLPVTEPTVAVLGNDGNPGFVRIAVPATDHANLEDIQRLIAQTAPVARSDASAEPPLLQPPLRRGVVNRDPGFYGILFFVDQDLNYPKSVLDYNCGDRTYDTEWFNHKGIDYIGPRFPRRTMAEDGLIAIAAADGTIFQKHDGESDTYCGVGAQPSSNLIILEHLDGSYSTYGHLKQDSLTPRQVGDKVEAGDYLGVIGSSGTAIPHLEFIVLDNALNLIEPCAGPCNYMNSEGWWAEQEDYYVKTINAVATHDAFPEYPPCPQEEIPHFQNEFMLGDTVFMTVSVRDFTGEDEIGFRLAGPDLRPLEWTYSEPDVDHMFELYIRGSVEFYVFAPSGAYTLAVTYGGNTVEHVFYLNSGPDPLPEAVVDNNAYAGAWYDPTLDGEGYNIVTANGGTVAYFYGSDERDNRLWLISDLFPGPIRNGQPVEIDVYESTGGTFATPVSSTRGLSAWGKVIFEFADCASGQATLQGVDGTKVSQIVKLAGVAGTNCTPGDEPSDAAMSGAWYDPTADGEGYNVIVTPAGTVLYFYGFKSDGLRLWLMSDLITEELDVGVESSVPVFEAMSGVFDTPVPSGESLEQWGTMTITVVDCNHMTIVLEGRDGTKISNTLRLAGIIGLGCA